MIVETNTEPENELSLEFSQVSSVMNGGSGIMRIEKNGQTLYKRQSSYFYLEFIKDAED